MAGDSTITNPFVRARGGARIAAFAGYFFWQIFVWLCERRYSGLGQIISAGAACSNSAAVNLVIGALGVLGNHWSPIHFGCNTVFFPALLKQHPITFS
ncbi:MAG: hypothetical protein H6656_11685 [Ardenticatenaceae bacterium]|nr:hypothetical protein [Ardenticatenaceae bacterium]